MGFAVIQTVFEGNAREYLREVGVNQLKASFLSFGHDEQPTGSPFPTFMEDYRTHEELRGLRLSTLAVALFSRTSISTRSDYEAT